MLELNQKVRPWELILQALESNVLPFLQNHAEKHVIVGAGKATLKTIPPLPEPGAIQQHSAKPLIRRQEPLYDQWLKDAQIGLIYVLRGQADLLVGSRVVTCNAGNFVLFLPHTRRNQGLSTHWERKNQQEADSDLMWLFVKPDVVFSHLCWSRGTAHSASPNLFIPDNKILSLTELLYEELQAEQVSPAAAQILWLIFERLQRKILKEQYLTTHVPSPENNLETVLHENIGERARQYIDANLMQRLTLESVAHAIFTSRSTLSREFLAHTGETFANYVLRCRIELAQDLLLNTSHTIRTIAWHAGFADADYFCRAFRRSTGKTPTQYRNDGR